MGRGGDAGGWKGREGLRKFKDRRVCVEGGGGGNSHAKVGLN